MDQRLCRALASGLALSLVLLGGAGQALAHDKSASPVRVKGLVTDVNAVDNGTIQIQTSSSSITLGLTSTTRVIRAVSGSLADVSVNDHIVAHLTQGTNTIRSILLDDTTKPKVRSVKHDHTTVPDRTPTPSHTPIHSRPARPAPRLPVGEITGQVVSINNNSMTIRGGRNQTTTYSLSNSVTVTKLMNGNFGNLAIGETVVAMKTQNDSASTITIMNA